MVFKLCPFLFDSFSLPTPVHIYYFPSICLVLGRNEIGEVNWTNKVETIMSKNTGMGESVDVGDNEEAGLVGFQGPH